MASQRQMTLKENSGLKNSTFSARTRFWKKNSATEADEHLLETEDYINAVVSPK